MFSGLPLPTLTLPGSKEPKRKAWVGCMEQLNPLHCTWCAWDCVAAPPLLIQHLSCVLDHSCAISHASLCSCSIKPHHRTPGWTSLMPLVLLWGHFPIQSSNLYWEMQFNELLPFFCFTFYTCQVPFSIGSYYWELPWCLAGRFNFLTWHLCQSIITH